MGGVNDEIDWTAIEFPSDRLTLGAIRKQHVDLLVDADRGAHVQYSQFDTFPMLAAEMDIAAVAYARAAGLPDPFAHLHEEVAGMKSRPAMVAVLDNAYQKYGLSSGPQLTEHLVRGIEAAAEKQASEVRGRRP